MQHQNIKQWQAQRMHTGQVYVYDQQGPVCHVELRQNNEQGIDKRKADALLIAAAPDMLNMLEFVLASGNCELDHETAFLIQNTINKAKGE